MKLIIFVAVCSLFTYQVNSLECYKCSNVGEFLDPTYVIPDCFDYGIKVECGKDKLCGWGHTITSTGLEIIYRDCMSKDIKIYQKMLVSTNIGKQWFYFAACQGSFCNG
ncbi:uncharacterized protein [Antedon mediterranea]|uniref:uncharacterized protein n=1 Tax=Antedon mediterranea TaxID=105859 RepID=UPI003AF9E084